MNLQPLEDRIVVRPSDSESTTASGLVIPDSAKEKPQEAGNDQKEEKHTFHF